MKDPRDPLSLYKHLYPLPLLVHSSKAKGTLSNDDHLLSKISTASLHVPTVDSLYLLFPIQFNFVYRLTVCLKTYNFYRHIVACFDISSQLNLAKGTLSKHSSYHELFSYYYTVMGNVGPNHHGSFLRTFERFIYLTAWFPVFSIMVF